MLLRARGGKTHGKSIDTRVERLEGRRLFAAPGLISAAIDFQPAASPAIPGYFQDNGATFGDRQNGLIYGWNVNLSSDTRIRRSRLATDPRYDTLVAFRPGDTWQIGLPDGSYEVHIALGDAKTLSGLHEVLLQGMPLVFVSRKKELWAEWDEQVQVTDGVLSITAPGGIKHLKSDEIDYVDIVQAVGAGLAPTPTQTRNPRPSLANADTRSQPDAEPASAHANPQRSRSDAPDHLATGGALSDRVSRRGRFRRRRQVLCFRRVQ